MAAVSAEKTANNLKKKEYGKNTIISLIQHFFAVCSLAPEAIVSACTKDKGTTRPTIMGSVHGSPVKFLVDSGASISACTEECLLSIAENTQLRRLPVSPSLKLSGVTGHGLQIKDCIEMPIVIEGKTLHRPMLVVDCLHEADAILGWDTIVEEGFRIEGSSGTTTIHGNEDWNIAALVAGNRTKIWPRCVQQVEVISMLHNGHLPPQEVGLCQGLWHAPFGVLDGVTQVKGGGKTTIAVVNTTSEPIELQAGDQLAVMQNIKATEVREFNEATVNSIFGKIGKEPSEPQRGQIHPLGPEDRKNLLSRLHIHAPQPWKKNIEDLIIKYHDVCSKDKFDLGRASVIKHSIVMKDNIPSHSRQFRIPIHHEHVVHDYVDSLLKQGAIEISRSPYNSAIFCVPKKVPPDWPAGVEPPMRVVLDYRAVNMRSVPDRMAINDIREYIDEIGKKQSRWFTTIDLTSSFWQQELADSSRQYTAFTVPGRGTRYQWSVTPMGLQGSPASFCKLIQYCLRDLPGVLCYIDDLLQHTRDLPTHLSTLELVFLRLRKYGMKLNVDKTCFCSPTVQYLGFTLDHTGVSLSKDKLAAIKEAKPPRSLREIRTWVGLVNYFRFLVPSFNTYSGVLTALTKKESKWDGGDLPPRALDAFLKMKAMLMEPPVVAYPQTDRPFILHTDAAQGDAESPGGLGAALLQHDDQGHERVIAFASRALKKHEANYSAYLLELAAAVFGIEYFDTYLRGRKFTLFVDHKPLEKLSVTHTKTLNRLQQLMIEYSFDTQYRPGKDNSIADYLSRSAWHRPKGDQINYLNSFCEEDSGLCSSNQEQVDYVDWGKKSVLALTDDTGTPEAAQLRDSKMQDIIKYIKTKSLPSNNGKHAQWVRRIADKCFLKNNLLWHRYERPGYRSRDLLFAPQEVRRRIVEAAHAQLDAGHGGKERTINRVLLMYWWPGLTSDVAKFVSSCEICNTSKSRMPNPVPLQSMPICNEKNFRIHIDLFGPLKTSQAGRKYICVMTDAFSKIVELAATEDKEAETIARVFFERWLCRYTAPKYLVSDRGREFCNTVLDLVCELWGVERLRTTAYHPETNSSAESYNRTIIKYMRAVLSNDHTTDWEMYLMPMQMAYNCHVHASTKESPFFLTYLYDPRLPMFDIDRPRRLYGENYATEAFQISQATNLRVKENLEHAQKLQEDYFNKTAKHRTYLPGDKILIHFPNTPPAANKKFFSPWRIFTVVQMVGRVNVQARETSRSKPILVHVNRTKLFSPDQAGSHFSSDLSVDKSAASAESVTSQRPVTQSSSPFQRNPSAETAEADIPQRPITQSSSSFQRNPPKQGTAETASQNKKFMPEGKCHYNLRPRHKMAAINEEFSSSEDEECDFIVVARPTNTGGSANHSLVFEEESDEQDESFGSFLSATEPGPFDTSITDNFVTAGESLHDTLRRINNLPPSSGTACGTAEASTSTPSVWQGIAENLLPNVTPYSLRSSGPVPDVDLPRLCPTSKRARKN